MEKNFAPLQKLKPAAKITGLSMHYLRTGCKNGSIPHIMSGGVYYVNIPALLKQLGVEMN